jgi:hypothetical protein
MSGLESSREADGSTDSGATGHEAEANTLELLFPADYSSDDADFAVELSEFFDLEQERLPPLLVPTLMPDEWQQPVVSGFETRLAYQVLRRLSLPRAPLFTDRPVLPSWSSLVETLADTLTHLSSVGRGVVGGVGMLLMLMVMCAFATGPSFAQGMQILLGQTGVQQVGNYPRDVHSPNGANASGAQSPSMPLAWLGPVAGDYAFLETRYAPATDWSKGKIVDVEYCVRHPSDGAGILDIREFQLSSKYAAVLQVVKTGSPTAVWIGDTPGVYVDGGWSTVEGRDGPIHLWQSGTRSALFFERDGVIYWIVADQRDGAGEQTLLSLAAQLRPASHRDLQPNLLTVRSLSEELPTLINDPIGDEVYQLIPAGVSQDAGIDSLVQLESRPRFGGHTLPAMAGAAR